MHQAVSTYSAVMEVLEVSYHSMVVQTRTL